MGEVATYFQFIPLPPLLGFVILTIFRGKDRLASILAPSCILASFALSLHSFIILKHSLIEGEAFIYNAFTWLPLGGYSIPFGLLYDGLSAVALLYVTGISFLVHLYSVGYMRSDKGYVRYFSFLNLFVFFMIMLVMSENLFEMFLGWEGVGLCSYLLIGFWFEDLTNARAGMKAFIVNRVGDFGFILGVLGFMIFAGRLDFLGLESLLKGDVDWGIIRVLGLLLFCGALGKSAQGPLWLWLPDAMRGPTPVSALIHAATMVTAGVYMVGRLDFIFLADEFLRSVVFWFGLITMIFAGLFGLFEFDMKKVLAFSTISQLGMMFCGVVCQVWRGIFHVVEHSFFKALLFLAAGNVMHFTGGVIDIRKLGGLGKVLRLSGIGFLIGACAMSGVPPFSGFWSKGAILSGIEEEFGDLGWGLILLGSFLTVLYIFRVWFLVFGSSGISELKSHTVSAHHSAHGVRHHEGSLVKREGGWEMFSVVFLLAILSVIGGIFNIGSWMGEEWGYEGLHVGFEEVPVIFMIAVAIFISWWIWGGGKDRLLAGVFIRGLFERKFFLDEIEVGLGKGMTRLISAASGVFDRIIIDGFVNRVGSATRGISSFDGAVDRNIVDGTVNFMGMFTRVFGVILRYLQAGVVEFYLLLAILGVFALVWLFVL